MIALRNLSVILKISWTKLSYRIHLMKRGALKYVKIAPQSGVSLYLKAKIVG